MDKKLLLTFLLAIVFLGGIIFLNFKKEPSLKVKGQENKTESSMIFFYGLGCPHCENVEKFLEKNKNVEEIIKFEKKEIWENEANAKIFAEKAEICQLPESEMGVPLFWDGERCLIGDANIIEFFKKKISE